ncbi:MAG: transposase [Deltaproteobacteria bacterium]|nr:transposase [Deltaproteobacteria bacterium]
MARARKRHIQLTFDQARKPDGRHGGWRPGAGRPPKPGAVSHAARPNEHARFPRHVTLRVVDGAPSLAREGCLKILRAVVRASHKDENGCSPNGMRPRKSRRESAALGAAGGFRIVEFNVLGNHIHLICEAGSTLALSRGIQGFCVRATSRLNAALGRAGQLFAHRYHARALKSPREVRNAIAYVLLNRKHHDADKRYGRMWIDPASSAAWFSGWSDRVRADEVWKRELLGLPKPTAEPTTWLLTTGWKRHGLLRFDERPG